MRNLKNGLLLILFSTCLTYSCQKEKQEETLSKIQEDFLNPKLTLPNTYSMPLSNRDGTIA